MDGPLTVQAGPRWTVLLPPTWTTIPTDTDGARDAVKRLIDRRFEGKPRDELIHLRIELDRLLRAQAAQALEAGARQFHALTEPIRGLPVSATLIAVPVALAPDESLLDAIAAVLGQAVGVVESSETAIAGLPALRRLRRTRSRLADDAEAPEITSTHVEYVVALPDDTLLVLAFTTSTEAVRRQLVALFDAIAGTLQEVDPPTS